MFFCAYIDICITLFVHIMDPKTTIPISQYKNKLSKHQL